MSRNTAEEVERLTFTVEEAAKRLGLSRGLMYEAVHTGQIPSIRIGRRILIPRAALERKLEGRGAEKAPNTRYQEPSRDYGPTQEARRASMLWRGDLGHGR